MVGAAGLMWGHVVVAGPGPGGGLGALRLLPWGGCGARPAAAARCACCLRGLWGRAAAVALSRLLPWVTLGLVRIEGEWFPGM